MNKKLKLNIAKINENRRLVLGRVAAVNPSPSGKVVEVDLEGYVWNPEKNEEEDQTLRISFWNNDIADMADRVQAAKVREGVVLMVDIYEKDGKISGNNFKYNGHWILPATEEKRERNIFMGTAVLHEDPEGRFVKASVPVKNRDEEEPTWANITFWNDESHSYADRAKKALAERDGRKAKAVIFCGENKPYNEKPSYTGYDVILLPNDAPEAAAEAAE